MTTARLGLKVKVIGQGQNTVTRRSDLDFRSGTVFSSGVVLCVLHSIDVKNVFFYFGHVFLRFLTFFIFFYFVNVFYF